MEIAVGPSCCQPGGLGKCGAISLQPAMIKNLLEIMASTHRATPTGKQRPQHAGGWGNLSGKGGAGALRALVTCPLPC